MGNLNAVNTTSHPTSTPTITAATRTARRTRTKHGTTRVTRTTTAIAISRLRMCLASTSSHRQGNGK
eukprot:4998650-Alexandrium_andersonii.AAC.1